MNEQDLIKQLKSLKDVKPSDGWEKSNRDVLFTQISSGRKEAESADFLIVAKSYFSLAFQTIHYAFSQQALSLVLAFLLLVSGGIMSLNAAEDTTPGDSFYIAKKIGEKTQFALTFDQKKKAQLNVKFAGNRVKEIEQVLAKDNSDNIHKKEKNETVEKLTSDFKKEISDLKTRINKINIEKVAVEDSEGSVGDEVPSEDMVFSANLSRDAIGIQTSEQLEDEKKSETQEEKKTASGGEGAKVGDKVQDQDNEPLMQEESSLASSTVEEVSKNADTGSILNEVTELIENDEYDTSIVRLEEAVSSLEDNLAPDEGEVRGATEAASSTKDVVDTVDSISDEVGEAVDPEAASSTEE